MGLALVVELGVAAPDVVAALALPVSAVAPAALRHDHPVAIPAPVAHVRVDVPPAPGLGDLPAGVARLLGLQVADAIAGLGRRDAGEAGCTQAQDGAEGETGAEGRWHRSLPRSDGSVNVARRSRFLARTAKLRTRLTVRREGRDGCRTLVMGKSGGSRAGSLERARRCAASLP